MKKVLLAAIGMAISAVSIAQTSQESSYYLDISAGYSVALPPFSNGNSRTLLAPNGGGSMSFSLARKVGDRSYLQIEVLSSVFTVKNSDFRKVTTETNPMQLDLRGYSSTFFGIGGVRALQLGMSKATLDLKGSIGLNMTEYAEQKFLLVAADKKDENVAYTAKRSYAPGAVAGARLRYPISETVDLGLKVEYGVSRVSFDVKRETGLAVTDTNQSVVESLGSSTRMLSFLNTGITLGLRF